VRPTAASAFTSLYLDDVIFVAAVLIVAMVVTRIGTIAVRRLQRRMEAAQSAKQELALQRASTVAHTLSYVVRVVVWTIAALTILGRANIQLGPLIAGAGVVGVALGFGAQSVVRDYLAGFYLLIEDQLDVGDVVDIFVGGVRLTGTVTELTLRTTWLRTDDGEVHIVPNGGIAYVTNHSRGEGPVRITVRLDPFEDADEIRRIVEGVLAEVRADPRLRRSVFDGPAVVRTERKGDALEVDVAAVARPERRQELSTMLRERLEHRLRPLPTDVDIRVDPPTDAGA
jgi:moderate conductance mechanosensitive channel